MEQNQMLKDALQAVGVNAQYDEDGDLYFLYQMKYIYVTQDENDQFVSLSFPNFMEVNEDNLTPAFITCNKITREVKLLKVFMNSNLNGVSAACEFFYSDFESMKNSIQKSLLLIGVVRTLFKKTAKKLSR